MNLTSDYSVKGFDTNVDLSDDAYQIFVDGYRFVGRYITTKLRRTSKHLTPLEAARWHNDLVKILPIYESNPTTVAYFSAEQGHKDASIVLEACVELGIPSNTPVVITADLDTTITVCASYLQQYRRTLRSINHSARPILLYGSGSLIYAARTLGYIDGGMQAQSPGWAGFDMHLTNCPVRQLQPVKIGRSETEVDGDECTLALFNSLW